MDKYDNWNRMPDYMDRFTGIKSDRYSDIKLRCDLMFTDSCGKVYTGIDFKVPAAVRGTWKIQLVNEGKTLKKDSRISIFYITGVSPMRCSRPISRGRTILRMKTAGMPNSGFMKEFPASVRYAGFM